MKREWNECEGGMGSERVASEMVWHSCGESREKVSWKLRSRSSRSG